MESILIAKMETRLVKGKSVMKHEGIDYEEDNKEDTIEAPQKAQQHTGIELFMRRSYSIPERPDVKVERTVWAYRER